MVFTPVTVSHLYENIRFLFENGFENVIASYNAYDLWTEESLNVFSVQLDKISTLYLDMYKLGRPVKIKFFTQSIIDFLSGRGKPDCGACKDTVGILPNGDILSCGAFIGCPDYADYCIGSIYDKIDMKLISTYLNDSCIDYEECLNCSFLSRCHNKCFVCNKRCTGDRAKIPLSTCEINKLCIIQTDKILDYMFTTNNETFFSEYSEYLK